MKALVLLAHGFEEVEAITQIDFLRRGGIDVTTASIHNSKDIVGGHNITVEADFYLSEIYQSIANFDIVVLPGGGGGMNELKNSVMVVDLLKRFYNDKKWIAAICASPSIFGALGFVKGRKCTCYPGFDEEMIGGTVTGENVVVDGNVITSKGPGTSIDFALAMIEVLVDKETADKVASDAQYKR